MFTGLIEEVGKIKAITKLNGGLKITVEADVVMNDVKIDDSVAIEGVCQTVVAVNSKTFDVIAVDETMRKTNFANLKTNAKVNLERALTLSTRLGGHIVQGHVDCTGRVESIVKEGTNYLVKITFPNEYQKYIIPVGSICINGVSLTAARVEGNSFTVAIIPHTWDVTTIGDLKTGTIVNLEFDLLGKYIEKQLQFGNLKKESIWEQFADQPKI